MKKVFIAWVFVFLLASCGKEYNQEVIVNSTTSDEIISEVLNDIEIENNKIWDQILSEIMNWIELK